MSRILMDAPPSVEDCRPFVRVASMLHDAGVHAPEVTIEDLEHGYLLLEDLGDATYLAAMTANVPRPALYQDAVNTLIQMQSIDASQLPAYDEVLLRRELGLFDEWFVGVHLKLTLPACMERVQDELVACALEQPQVFVHRDFHSRNLMYLTDHNPGVIDFQDAVRGPVSYDFASLFRDAYVEWSRPQMLEWIDQYRRKALKVGIACGSDAAEFERWVDWVGVQRQLKVAGIFARLNYRDGKVRYMDDIPLTLRYARDACQRYPELQDLARWLDAEVFPRLEGRA